jgi:hypothetical protein
MNQEWQVWSVSELQRVYEQAAGELEEKLLSGVSWEEVAEQRREVTELAILVYKRLSVDSETNPAEHLKRNHTKRKSTGH